MKLVKGQLFEIESSIKSVAREAGEFIGPPGKHRLEVQYKKIIV